MSVEKETSIYKVTYKQVPKGCTMTKFGMEIIIYGCDRSEVEDRLTDTLAEMEISIEDFKIIKIERK